MKLTTSTHQMLADTITPVGIYLNLRDKFPGSVLLESSDYSSKEDSLSFIAFDTLAEIQVHNNQIITKKRNETTSSEIVLNGNTHFIPDQIREFISSFSSNQPNLPFDPCSFYGYNTFESVQYFEDIKFSNKNNSEHDIPAIQYKLFRYQLIIDHFKNELTLIESIPEDEISNIEQVINLISRNGSITFDFNIGNLEESSNITDNEYLSMVKKGIEHCQLGDVFQIVLSRRFQQKFNGDEFNVYRALRSINPSPYLFFFDFEDFKLFGSSPEAQLKVQEGAAEIHPIAGTYKRTGDFQKDQELAIQLQADPKENAEHTMLVDLARNDLSKSAKNVAVKELRQIQYFSHVIHMTSKVTGDIDQNSYQTFGDTFPAGTLSGAPKYKALQLIDEYETTKRGFYGGSVGIISGSGNINKAILIRSFLCKENTLYFQAGAGVVAKSNPESELQEVNNKIAALRKAIQLANNL